MGRSRLVFVSEGTFVLTAGAAVTLEGTIIHKSGLITGGKSSQTNGKKWEEKDVQGAYPSPYSGVIGYRCPVVCRLDTRPRQPHGAAA